jgi:hypothetical protein
LGWSTAWRWDDLSVSVLVLEMGLGEERGRVVALMSFHNMSLLNFSPLLYCMDFSRGLGWDGDVHVKDR